MQYTINIIHYMVTNKLLLNSNKIKQRINYLKTKKTFDCKTLDDHIIDINWTILIMMMTLMIRSERYSFYAVEPTSLSREMQIVSPLPALPKAPTVPLFFSSCRPSIPPGIWQNEFYF